MTSKDVIKLINKIAKENGVTYQVARAILADACLVQSTTVQEWEKENGRKSPGRLSQKIMEGLK